MKSKTFEQVLQYLKELGYIQLDLYTVSDIIALYTKERRNENDWKTYEWDSRYV